MSQTVLILDDEPDNIALIQTTLRRQLPEVGVVTFNAPREALAWCALHEPDLCLVDYKMPGMTGVDFIRAVREFAHFQSVPLIMITGQSDQTLQQRALEIGATDFLAKPYNAPDIVARTRNHLRMRESLRERRADLNGLEHEVLSQARRVVEDEQTRIIERLTRLSGYRDEETSSHMQRMARLARLIAWELGLDRRFRELLLMAAPLHDIGKVGIPDRILLKPGKLDAIEWGIMKTHTRIGYDLLRDSSAEVMQLGAEIAHAHHEKWGGDGYPNGLAGDAIPLAGRIVAVADVFDALLNVRHYKPAWALADTLEQLRAERGRHFDPACVNALLRRLDEAMDIQKQFAEVSATTPAAAIRPPAPMNP
jgi:response regulator RpfG family c-di-GMP phosphodiesterase